MLHPVLTNPDSRYSQEMDEYDNPLQEHHYDDGYEPIMDLESIESLHQEAEPELDAFSDVNSEYMKLPLPEGIDDHEDSLEYEPSISGDHSQTLPEDTFILEKKASGHCSAVSGATSELPRSRRLTDNDNFSTSHDLIARICLVFLLTSQQDRVYLISFPHWQFTA